MTAAGKYGNALSFDGGFVDLGNPGALQLTGSMTVSAWIYSTTFPSNDAAIVSKYSGGDPTGFQIDTTVDTGPRTIGFKLVDPMGNQMIRYGASALQVGQWYHVSGVYDAGAQTMTVYLNGVPDNGTLVGTVASSQTDSLLNVNVGRRSGADGYEFRGTIDDVRIYNRVLSATERQRPAHRGYLRGADTCQRPPQRGRSAWTKPPASEPLPGPGCSSLRHR